MKVTGQIIFIAAFLGFVNCQSLNDLDVDQIKKDLEGGIPELEQFNTTNLPNAEDFEKVLRQKCEKAGAPEAADSLKDQQEEIKTCIEQHVNFTEVQQELEVAKKSGSMDEVFGKYCKKWPAMYECVEKLTVTARLCMDHKEKVAFNKSLEILHDLQEFMCFKDGDRLAMFVAEGGVECVQEQKTGVQQCVNETFGARMPNPDELSLTTLPTFLFTDQDCSDFDKVRVCVNTELEKCKDSTPANIVDAFFKFLKKHMPCGSGEVAERKVVAAAESGNSGSWSFASSTLLIVVSLSGLRMH